MDYIYRNFTISIMHKKACTNFIHAIALSGASIMSSYSLCAGSNYTKQQVKHQSIFFCIKFYNQQQLDKFHSFGLNTDLTEQISNLM